MFSSSKATQSPPDVPRHRKRDRVLDVLNPIRNARSSPGASPGGSTESPAGGSGNHRPTDERSVTLEVKRGTLARLCLFPSITQINRPRRRAHAIQDPAGSKHHYGDTYDTTNTVNGTANYISSVAKASLGTHSVTTIEHAEKVIYSSRSGNEALLWDSLPRQRDVSGLDANAYLEGSREDSVQDILGWVEDPTSELALFIHAPAGLGKSTLARHLTHRLNAAGRLAASVYLSGIPRDARGPESVVKLISREIGEKYREAIPTILEAIGSCKGAPLEDHVEMYLRDPLRSLGLPHALTVVFDAVDEWESHEALLKALPSLTSSSTVIKFIFLGRSDPRTRGFKVNYIRPYALHPVPTAIMAQYFVKQFEDVKWGEGPRPTTRHITRLAQLANGLFIWAAVVCSLLQKRLSRLSPNTILDTILDSRKSLGDGKQLATLYHQAILWLFPDSEDQDLFRDYMGATLALQESLPLAEFASLTGLPILVIEGIQIHLMALQIRKAGDKDEAQAVYPAHKLFHLSFLEYIASPSTPHAVAFHISIFDSHSQLAECCLRELPLFLPSSHPLTSLDLAPRQKHAVAWLPMHIYHGTPAVRPGASVEWRSTRHCALLRQYGFQLLGQWRDLFVSLVAPDYVDVGSFKAEYTDDEAVLVMLDVDEVLKTMAEDTPARYSRIPCLEMAARIRTQDAKVWCYLGWAYWSAAQTSRSREPCERAVAAHESALLIADEAESFDRAHLLYSLATALNTRYERLGNVQDLNRAIELHQSALVLRPQGHPDRMICLNNFARAILCRSGSTRDEDEAIRLLRCAVDLSQPGDSNISMYLTNLASLLDSRFADTGVVDYHNEAIALFEEALDLRPPGHADRVASLDNLATSFYHHFWTTKSTDSIDKAIRLRREVLELHPFGHSGRIQSLDILASYLRSRSWSIGSINELNEATRLRREVLQLITPDHANWATSLHRLAACFSSLFANTGSITDLDESIRLRREVLDLSPPTDRTNRAVLLNGLAWSLVLRHEAQGSTDKLSESIQLSLESLDLLAVGHPTRFYVLDTLARALLHNSETLEEALQLSRESISLAPPRNHSHWEPLMTLVIILHRLYERSGEIGQLQEAISTCEEALSLCPTTDPCRSELVALKAKLAEAELMQPSTIHT